MEPMPETMEKCQIYCEDRIWRWEGLCKLRIKFLSNCFYLHGYGIYKVSGARNQPEGLMERCYARV